MNQPATREYNITTCRRFLEYNGEELTEQIEQFEKTALVNRWRDLRKVHITASLLNRLVV